MIIPSPLMLLVAGIRLLVSGIRFVTAQEENYPVHVTYIAYFSDSSSSCTQFAGIKGVISDDGPTDFTLAREDGDGNEISCTDAMACLYMPDGPTCKAFGDLNTVAINHALINDGTVHQCDASNLDLGQPECTLVDYSWCAESSVYNCHWKLLTQEMLKEIPSSVTNDTAGLEQYALLAYYDDTDCTKLVGMRGFVANDPWSMTGNVTDQGLPVECGLSMACFLHENGTICESLDSTKKPAGDDLKIEADGEVYLCRTNSTEPNCSVLPHDQCITSGFYPCQYHWISAHPSANDPASFAAPSTDTATGGEAPKPTDTPSAACSFFVPLGGLIGAILVMLWVL